MKTEAELLAANGGGPAGVEASVVVAVVVFSIRPDADGRPCIEARSSPRWATTPPRKAAVGSDILCAMRTETRA